MQELYIEIQEQVSHCILSNFASRKSVEGHSLNIMEAQLLKDQEMTSKTWILSCNYIV